METAGKMVEDGAERTAMKESGIGTPATRAAIIEKDKMLQQEPTHDGNISEFIVSETQ
jgi:reverse gyrase